MEAIPNQQAIDELIKDDLKGIESSIARKRMRDKQQEMYEEYTTDELQRIHLLRFPKTQTRLNRTLWDH